MKKDHETKHDKKNQKKSLTTFFNSGMELKSFNLIVLFVSQSRKKGGDEGEYATVKRCHTFYEEVKGCFGG